MSKFIVGLTGGIGSGKSVVSQLFEEKKITVVDADVVAREVVQPGTTGLTEIAKHFGAGIVDEQGNLLRGQLREIIFSNPDEKAWLEKLLHPIINAEIRQQLAVASSDYSILSSPLLLETQQHLLVNRILVVDTSEEVQMQRAMNRDNNNPELIKAIMNSQMSRQERCASANDIIQNHGDISELSTQVEKYHQLYLELAQIHTANTLND
jgi:dephospho-CoA kinase